MCPYHRIRFVSLNQYELQYLASRYLVNYFLSFLKTSIVLFTVFFPICFPSNKDTMFVFYASEIKCLILILDNQKFHGTIYSSLLLIYRVPKFPYFLPFPFCCFKFPHPPHSPQNLPKIIGFVCHFLRCLQNCSGCINDHFVSTTLNSE